MAKASRPIGRRVDGEVGGMHPAVAALPHAAGRGSARLITVTLAAEAARIDAPEVVAMARGSIGGEGAPPAGQPAPGQPEALP